MSQGRGSALFVAIVVITIVVLHAGIAEAATYTVGSSGGWTFNVDSWPSGKRFRAGDTLCKLKTNCSPNSGIHNVVAVNKAGYDGCTTSRGARVYHTGTDQIKLAKGHNYFICTIEGHCASGMKIDIAAMYFTNIFTVQHGINDSTIYFDNNRPANTLLQTTNLHTKYKQSKQHNLTSLSSIHQSTNDHSLAPPNNHTHTQTSTNASPPEKRSFGVATGELFLGIASRILKTTNGTDRVSKVVVEPDVIWEQRVKDVEAEKQRMMMINTTSPGFSFSAAGLLFPYHLGVAQFLIQKGYIKETTPLAGSSAGAIVCAVIASGASMDEAMVATKKLAEDCRLNGTAFRLGAVLREILEEFLPEDVHIRSNGRVRVAVTQILWRPRGLLVDQFDSREDLINAIITSSFIPGYLAPRPATMFRDRLCIDGGLTLFMPPTSAAQTVRICAFPASRLGLQGIGISPDCNPENRSGPRELFNWALEPAEDSILDRLFELGYQDAAVWAEENPAEEIVRDDNACPETGLTL